MHVHFKDLNCSGSEESLFNCTYNQFAGYYCSNYDDASVICQCKASLYIVLHVLPPCLSVVTDVTYSNCSNGAVRLTGGSNQYEGRVELCVNGVWGSVCDSGWDNREASTVCRQLGYQGLCFLAKYIDQLVSVFIASSYKTNSFFGVGNTPIHIYYTSCSSSSTNLLNCYLNWFPYYYSYCNNYQEAGVVCECECIFVFCVHLIIAYSKLLY